MANINRLGYELRHLYAHKKEIEKKAGKTDGADTNSKNKAVTLLSDKDEFPLFHAYLTQKLDGIDNLELNSNEKKDIKDSGERFC